MDPKKRLIIIDSNSLIHRAYHALPPLTTKKGELINAVYGFCLVFLKALKELEPDYLVATFDFPGPTFRHKEFKEYKGKRPPAPKELYQQIPKVKEILKAFGVPIFEKEGFEADDLVGAIAKAAPKKQVYPRVETIILSGDLDNLQLVNDQTKLYALKKGIKETILYDVEKVKERYGGLSPEQLVDFKALKGDPSDNVPGVTGIGEKTAIQLMKNFGSLENLYRYIENPRESASKKEIRVNPRVLALLKQHKEQAFISKSLVQVRCDIPIELELKKAEVKAINQQGIVEVLKRYEFYTLLKRLEEMFQSPSSKQKTIRFAGKENQINQEIEKLEKEGILSPKIAEVERALVPIVKKMTENGIKVNSQALSELSKNIDLKIKNLEGKIYEFAGQKFNLNSSQQLGEILFKKLKIPSKDLKRTGGGAISTGAEELNKLRENHPIIKLILKYRALFKLKSGFVDALPKMINPKDGKIHPHWQQLGTVTGRMSCSEPNLQNIPVRGEIAREIRKCFVPEKEFFFLSADYSQMELRIAASLSKDKKMIDYFKKGEDIHKLTASDIFNVEKEKVTQKMRGVAKSLNFGILYGMGPRAFSGRTGIPFHKAKKFIEKYFKNFKGIAEYIKNSLQKVKKFGYVQTIFGRKRFLPEINSIDLKLKAQAERIATNMPVQGSSADIIKMAMVEIDKIFPDSDCKMVLQIHDELLFEIKSDRIKEIAPKIKKIMEDVVKLQVPLKVDIKVGKNWGELGELEQRSDANSTPLEISSS